MDRTFLVEAERNASIRAVDALKQSGDEFDLILAAKLAEYSSARLVLASPAFAEGSQIPSYRRLLQLLRPLSNGEDAEDLPSLLLLGDNDPFVRDLRERLGPLDRSRGLHVEAQSFGSHFVEDGYVFHIQ